MKRKESSASGFTLIEILAVVIIIGILAAIAIPEYQAAVARTKMASLIPMLRALKDDMEMRHLTDGGYPADDAQDVALDIEMFDSCTSPSAEDYIACPKDVYFDIYADDKLTVGVIDGKHQVAYLLWLDHSDYPNEKRCLANKDNTIANKVCQSLKDGEVLNEDYGDMSVLGGEHNYIVYHI